MTWRVIMLPLTVIAFSAVLISQGSAVPNPQTSREQGGDHLNTAATTQKPNRQNVYKDGQRGDPANNTDLFAYPAEPSEIDSRGNAKNRTPVFLPFRCLENEILWPGDQDSDWVCDCKPTFVYHPPTRKCYEMFTQGYCEPGKMISLKLNAKHPECIDNSCAEAGRNSNDSYVMFHGECVALNQKHEKCWAVNIDRVVAVDEKTNELACRDISAVKDLKLNITQPTTQGGNGVINQQPIVAEKDVHPK